MRPASRTPDIHRRPAGDPGRPGQVADRAAPGGDPGQGAAAGRARSWRTRRSPPGSGCRHPAWWRGGPGSPRRGWRSWARCAKGRGRKPSIPAGEGRGDRGGDAARQAARRDALELPVDGKGAGRQPGHGAADLVRQGAPAAPGGDVQALQRQAVRGEARRRRGPVPEPAGQGRRAVHGREEPDPGPGPHPADPADEARAGPAP